MRPAAPLLCLALPVAALDNGVGRTPPMGFNTWNHFHAGDLQASPQKFPHGMKWLADYTHNRSLKFGIYSSASSYDKCSENRIDNYVRNVVMRDALNDTGRIGTPETWLGEVGNAWRTTGDISNSFGSILTNLEDNNKFLGFSGPGAWNDADMLEVGNGALSAGESRLHFALWCLIKSPLIIGSDIRALSGDDLELLTNAELIAVNQDPLGGGLCLGLDGTLVTLRPCSGA
eukprot:gene26084-37952_t